MRARLLPLALALCLLSTGIDMANAQPPYRRTPLHTIPGANQLALRQLIMNYLTPPVIGLHLTPGIHNADEYFLSWHRNYIAGLEAWLMTQPGGSDYVPLPKYDPTTPVPNAFFNNLMPGNAVATGYPPLLNQNPMISLAWLLNPPNPCQWTADGFGSAVDGPHGSVHVAIGGSMGATTTASAAAIFWAWHAYLDDMYRYYQCICQGARPKDLYMKDDVRDIGDEPNTTAPNNVYNGSPDIWVRDNPGAFANDPTHHQNPTPGSLDYVYVRIRNRGCQRVNAGEVNLHVYWSCFSTGAAAWPAGWTQIVGTPIPVPALDPGKEYVAQIPWNVPQNVCNGRFCLLARLVSGVDPMAVVEGADVIANVRNNNNIAVRNVDVVPADPYNCTPSNPCNDVNISQVYGNSEYGKIRFDYGYDQQHNYNPVYVEVDLGQDLYNVWAQGGYDSYGIDDGQRDDYKVRVTQPGAYLGNLHLQPGVTYDPCVRAYVQNPETGGYGGYGGYDGYSGDAGYPGYGGYGGGKGGSYGGYSAYGGVYPIHVSQYESYGGEGEKVVGGATYEVRAQRDYAAVPQATYVQEYSITPASCPQSYDGSIQLDVYNDPAAGEYTYWWSNGANTRDVYDLRPGTYSVVVRNNNNCAIDTREYVVGSYSTLDIEMESYLAHCDNPDGRVQCAVTGGIPPYAYQWYHNGNLLPGATGPVVNNALYGDYRVDVTDAGGCTIQDYMRVENEWDMLTVNVEYTDASGPNVPDGRAHAVAHGMPTLRYQWSNGATTEYVQGLVPGQYWVDVTDMSGAGCTKRRYFAISYTQNQLNVDGGNTAISNVLLVPNPAFNTTELRYSQQRSGAVQIELYDNLGRRVDLLYSGHLKSGDQTLPIATDGLASGQYVVRIVTAGVTTTVPLTVVH